MLESFQDFLNKLDMQPCMHLVEISIFSLNFVLERFNQCSTLKNDFENQNFEMSEVIILVGLTVSLISEKMLISTRCIHGFMSNLIKKS